MPKLDDQIATLQEKLQLLKLRQQRVDSRKLAVDAQRARKAETRKRILVGTIVMAKAEHGEIDPHLLLSWLDSGLTRGEDRKLFGLSISETFANDV